MRLLGSFPEGHALDIGLHYGVTRYQLAVDFQRQRIPTEGPRQRDSRHEPRAAVAIPRRPCYITRPTRSTLRGSGVGGVPQKRASGPSGTCRAETPSSAQGWRALQARCRSSRSARDARIPFRQDECVNPASATGRGLIDQAELFEQKATHRVPVPTRHRTFQLAHTARTSCLGKPSCRPRLLQRLVRPVRGYSSITGLRRTPTVNHA
jgi:hypothetical protein